LWNVGGSAALSLAEIAETISRAAGAPAPQYQPFPAEHKSIDIGSYVTDSSRIRKDLGWRASVPFEEGIRRTLDYYRREMPHYLAGCPSIAGRRS
jgi:nucleoside-diphosphate-sugar epimerase